MNSRDSSTEIPLASSVEYRAATSLFGTLSGAALGSFAGPPGVLAGALIGAIVGAMAAVVLDRQAADAFARERRREVDTEAFPLRRSVVWSRPTNPRHSWAGI
jgi:uncharacterized membrane protein